MNGFLWRLRERGLALLVRLGLAQPGKIMYIGGSDTLPAPLSREEEGALIARLEQGDAQARNQLIEHNLRLVAYIARRFENTGINIEDLISIGTIGLIKGISTFKVDKNVRLATYASRCIENEILMHFRSQRKLQGEVSLADTLETAGEGGSLSLMDVIAVDDTMLEDLDTRDACRRVRRCVDACLDDRERRIIICRYGLDDHPPQTQREIAAQCGISRSYVSRIEKRALEKLAAAMDGWRPG